MRDVESYHASLSIPEDEKKRYRDFTLELSQELGSILSPPETMLWHYTNGSALISILDSMSIYSTHISCLNDTTEMRYGSSLFQEALADLQRCSHDTVVLKLLDAAVGYFKENPDFPAQASS